MCCKGKTTLENGGRDPPDYSLEYIVKDLLSYFNEFKSLDVAKTEAEKKYGIIKEHDDCWPAVDIKRAWGKTQRMGKTSCRRRHWSLVIMMQVIQKQKAGNLVQRCAEMSVNDTPDQMKARRKNKRREDNKVDISSQSTAVQGTVAAAGGDEQHSGGNPQISSSGQTGGVSQGWTGTPNTVQSQSTGNNRGGFNGQDGPAEALIQTQNKYRRETTYIRVPILEMIPIEQHAGEREVQNVRSDYKLIAGVPGTERDSEIRRRQSYVMSFNRQTGNANWVYEILNRSTLHENPVEAELFEVPYDRGHLAAAANHRWCREASDDADMIDNIVPQHQDLNRGPWKWLEIDCRETAKAQHIRNVHVYSGPLYLRDMNPPVIREKRVPSHFFKLIIAEYEHGRLKRPQCYLFPNQNILVRRYSSQENLDNLEQYRTRDQRDITIEDIQRDSGLTFTAIRQNAVAREITGTWHGEDGNTVQRTANIRVTICS